MKDSPLILAEKILQRNFKDIKKYEKIDAPDINYCRSMGFGFSLDFTGDKGVGTCWSFNLGGVDNCQVSTLTMEKNYRPGFQWHMNVINSFLAVLPVEQAMVLVNDKKYRDEVDGCYKFPLGWINYFANDFSIKIPDDLPYVEYDQRENGKFFYLTREDFSKSEDVYVASIKKLGEVMLALKNYSPSYGRNVSADKLN